MWNNWFGQQEKSTEDSRLQAFMDENRFDLKKIRREVFRHEYKYLINRAEKEILILRLRDVIKLDKNAKNGGYNIRSLYFDDYWNTAYNEKEHGVLMRKKYRIRIYNYEDHTINLERKKKFGAQIFKESAPITKEEFEMIMNGDYEFLKHSKYSLCKEFYVECVCNVLRPRVIVDYEREPWIMDEGTVRITFDEDVRAAIGGFNIFDKDLPTLPVIDEDKIVLEVKYTEFRPDIVRNLIQPFESEHVAVSKYVLCYEKTAYMNGFEYWFEH